MTDELFFQRMRDYDDSGAAPSAPMCWRYLNDGRDVCIQARGHDGGVHEVRGPLDPQVELLAAARLLVDVDQCWHQQVSQRGDYYGTPHPDECDVKSEGVLVCTDPCPLCRLRLALDAFAAEVKA